jgi:hypothetical protein
MNIENASATAENQKRDSVKVEGIEISSEGVVHGVLSDLSGTPTASELAALLDKNDKLVDELLGM